MIFIASAWPIAGPKNVSELIAFCAITGFEPITVRFVLYLPRDCEPNDDPLERKLNDDPLDQTLNDLVDNKDDRSTIDDVDVERDSVLWRRSFN